MKLPRNLLIAGSSPDSAAAGVLILVHGRGADAPGIISLGNEIGLENFIFAAPQAANNTWYPYSFLEPVEKNEPHLTNSLNTLKEVIEYFKEEGFTTEKIFLLGFSQGACLSLEYAARFPARYGGVFALSGGIIGKENNSFEYDGKLSDTPVFLGCSDIDLHIPIERVNFTEKLFKELGADVIKKLYPNMGHTINRDELKTVKNLINVIAL